MKRSTILCSLLPVLLVLFLCACSASPSGASDGAETPNNIFHELPLPAVTEGQVSVLDARGSRILYVQEEKLLSKDGGYAYYETKQVGIYDVDAQKSLAVWEPETPGNYFGGPCWMEMLPFSPSSWTTPTPTPHSLRPCTSAAHSAAS